MDTLSPNSSLGLGMLCWKAYDVFDAALQTYQSAGLFDCFDEVVIFFPEIDDEARALAAKYNIRCEGSPDNLGICGGFRKLAEAMSSDICLLLENDLPLIEDKEETQRQIQLAKHSVATGEVAQFRLRHTKHPGQKFPAIPKYLRYHGGGIMPALRRVLRPGKARRLAGGALYVEEHPSQKFPRDIKDTGRGYYLVSAACLPWTNQSIMVQRNFFLDTILTYAESNPSAKSLVNGRPAIEPEWNGPVWQKSGWKIGVSRGLFTHERV